MCLHILHGTAKVAVRIPPLAGDEGVSYLCDRCQPHMWTDLEAEDLVSACMHCARHLTGKMKVYTLEEFENRRAG